MVIFYNRWSSISPLSINISFNFVDSIDIYIFNIYNSLRTAAFKKMLLNTVLIFNRKKKNYRG